MKYFVVFLITAACNCCCASSIPVEQEIISEFENDEDRNTDKKSNCSAAIVREFKTEPYETELNITWELNVTTIKECIDNYETTISLTQFDRKRNKEFCVDYYNISAALLENDHPDSHHSTALQLDTKTDCNYSYKIEQPHNIFTLHYHIKNLKPCASYKIETKLLETDRTILIASWEIVDTEIIAATNRVENLTVAPTNDAILLSWTPNKHSRACRIFYNINITSVVPYVGIPYYRRENHTQHWVQRLNSCTRYYVSVTPSNFYEESPENALIVTTLPDEVEDASIEFLDDSFTLISWNPPHNRDCISRYQITLWTNLTFITTNHSFTYPKELHCVPIEIAPVANDGRFGKSISISKPGPVRNLGTVTTDTTRTVKWKPPPDANCVWDYVLEMNGKITNTTKREVSFPDLIPCMVYEVQVAPRTKDRVSGVPVVLGFVADKPKDIGPVRNLHTIDGLQVVWDVPENTGNCNLSYTVQVHDELKEIETLETYERTYKSEFAHKGCTKYTISVKPKLDEVEGDTVNVIQQVPMAPSRPECTVVDVNKTGALIICNISNESEEHNNACTATSITITCNDIPIEIIPKNEIIEIDIDNLKTFTNYSCVSIATNNEGDSKLSNPIKFRTLQDVPTPPQNLEILEVTPTSFFISWSEPEDIPGFLASYRITIKSEGSQYFVPDGCPVNEGNFVAETLNIGYRFTAALPGYKYSVYVEASTEAGFGEKSEIRYQTTSYGVPEEPQFVDYEVAWEDLKEYDVNVSISWKYPCSTNGLFEYFQLDINGSPQIDLDSQIHEERHFVREQESNYEWTFLKLRPAYKYILNIKTVTRGNLESNVVQVNFFTPDGLPEAPVVRPITEITPRSFRVVWDEPKKKNGRILHYQLNITNEGALHSLPSHCEKPQSKYVFEVSEEGNSLSFFFPDALPNYKFNVGLSACTSNGCGDTSGIVFVQTPDSEPAPIQNLIAEVMSPESEVYTGSVEITFQRPCSINGPLRYFKVTLTGLRTNYLEDHKEVLVYPGQVTTLTLDLLADYQYELGVQVATVNYQSRITTTNFVAPSGVPPPILNQAMSPPSLLNQHRAEYILQRDLFDDQNGEILYYGLILAQKEHAEEPNFGFWDGTDDTWPVVQNGNIIGPYQTTPKFWNPFTDDNITTYVYILGDDDTEFNKPLQPGTVYIMKVRGFTDRGYRDSSTVIFEIPEDVDLALILGVVFGVILALACLLFFIILWRRRMRWAKKKEAEKSIALAPMPVSIKQFPKHYAELKNNNERLKQEFTLLGNKSTETILPGYDALLPENKKRNRYTNILPYDETRVKLKKLEEHCTDYINASYIKGISGEIEYIATQGPLEQTCEDFWHMIIQEDVSLIVMVAQFVEQNKEKCFKYFPANQETMTLENGITVRCSTELEFTSYIVRTLQIQKDLLRWTITHLHFTDWPDFGCPANTESMLEFCYLIREHAERNQEAPVAVHCSAGVGRTGTLIALDILLQKISHKKDIDIFGTVLNLRKDRKNMVQTDKQYFYIYNCVNDAIECPELMQYENTLKEPIYENIEDIKQQNKDKEHIKESQF